MVNHALREVDALSRLFAGIDAAACQTGQEITEFFNKVNARVLTGHTKTAFELLASVREPNPAGNR
jgi:hypothetical protein